MNQDQNQPLEEDANRDHLAGSGPIERSESGAEPAGAGAMPEDLNRIGRRPRASKRETRRGGSRRRLRRT